MLEGFDFNALASAVVIRAARDAIGNLGQQGMNGDATRSAEIIRAKEFLFRTGWACENAVSDFWFKGAEIPRPRNMEEVESLAISAEALQRSRAA